MSLVPFWLFLIASQKQLASPNYSLADLLHSDAITTLELRQVDMDFTETREAQHLHYQSDQLPLSVSFKVQTKPHVLWGATQIQFGEHVITFGDEETFLSDGSFKFHQFEYNQQSYIVLTGNYAPCNSSGCVLKRIFLIRHDGAKVSEILDCESFYSDASNLFLYKGQLAIAMIEQGLNLDTEPDLKTYEITLKRIEGERLIPICNQAGTPLKIRVIQDTGEDQTWPSFRIVEKPEAWVRDFGWMK